MTNTETTPKAAAELAIRLYAVVSDTLENDGDVSQRHFTEAMWLLMQMVAV